MCLHPNQATLVVGDQSGTIHVWDLTTDSNEQLVKGCYQWPAKMLGNFYLCSHIHNACNSVVGDKTRCVHESYSRHHTSKMLDQNRLPEDLLIFLQKRYIFCPYVLACLYLSSTYRSVNLSVCLSVCRFLNLM